MAYDGLSEREMKMMEEIGCLHRTIELYKLIELALTVRQGGDVNLTHKELEYARQTYLLNENINVEDYMADIRLRARLK